MSLTMSVQEVADFLLISKDTVHRCLADGRLTGVKIHHGRMWRVHRSSVNDYYWGRYVDGRSA